MQTPSFASATTDLSLGQRLTRVLHAPKGAFEALGDEPGWQDWVAPVVILGLIGAAATHLTLPPLDAEIARAQEHLSRLEPEKRDAALQQLRWMHSYGWGLMPFADAILRLTLVSVVLMGVSRWVFRSDAEWRHMLTVGAYSLMVRVPEILLRTSMAIFGGSPLVPLGPGALVPEDLVATYFGRLMMNIGLTTLWQVWILGVGLGVLGRIPVRRALICMTVLWALWAILSAVPPMGAPADSPGSL